MQFLIKSQTNVEPNKKNCLVLIINVFVKLLSIIIIDLGFFVKIIFGFVINRRRKRLFYVSENNNNEYFFRVKALRGVFRYFYLTGRFFQFSD